MNLIAIPSHWAKRVLLLGFGVAAVSITHPLHGQLHIDRVYVGNAGNAADTNGRGSVDYAYEIGKYEVTNAQYVAFLNAVAASDPHGLYNAQMTDAANGGIIRSGVDGSYTYSAKEWHANRPVTYITWYNAARFTNWYHNGQGNGDTEDGAYTLDGATFGAFTRNEGALAAIANSDEWYKAAYYDPTKTGETNYWLYATRSDIAPVGAVPNNTNANSGNLEGIASGSFDVGSYPLATSYYGTYDQAGNLLEYSEDFITGGDLWISTWGGNYNFGGEYTSSSGAGGANPLNLFPHHYNDSTTFRLMFTPIPEPSTYALLGAGIVGAGLLRKRRQCLIKQS